MKASPSQKSWLQENAAALVAVVVLGLVPYLSFLFSGKGLFASDQMGAAGWKFYFDALRHGTVPLWTDFTLGGMPTFDAGFGDGGYPVFLLLGMILPAKTFIGYVFVLHTLIAGVTAYILVKRFFGLSRLLSVALACAYMLNTNFLSHVHAGHTGKFYIMAWLPLSLFLLLRCLSSRARWYHVAGMALVMALIMTCNHPQLTYFVLMGYFLVWVWKTVQLVRAGRAGEVAWTTARFWGPILTGIGLVFFLFYPPSQWTKNFGVRGSGEKMTYEHATSWSMHPEETASLIVPEFGGLNEKYWGRNPFKLNSEYPGLSVWFLAVLGLALFRKEKERWFWLWAGIGLLAIIFGLGAHTPLFHLFYSFIPGIKNFRAPSMMLFWLATALLVMSADTLSRLSGDVPEEKRKAWAKRTLKIGLGVSAFLLLCGFVPDLIFGAWGSIFGGEPWQNIANQAADKGAFAGGAIKNALLLAALVYGASRWLVKESVPLRFGWLLLAVTLVDLYWTDASFIQTYDTERYLSREPAVDFMKADTSHFRIFGVPGAYERWQMQYQGLETADGWTDNEYRLYREYRGGDYASNPNFMAGLKQNPDGSVSGSNCFDLLNVKYLAYRLPGEGALRLAENKSVLPRAWFAESWESSLPDSQALDRLKDPSFPRGERVLVSVTTALPSGFAASQDAAPQSQAAAGAQAALGAAAAATGDSTKVDSAKATAQAPEPAKSAAAVIETHRSYNNLAYKVNSAKSGILFLSELYFPNWHATVDGKEAPLLRVDYAFRGVALEAGQHAVVLEYRSPWIRKGFAISGLSLVILVGGLAGLRAAGRKGAGRPAGDKA